MRGINLDRYDFDYDLTWAAFFMNADEAIYGRFGGRDAESSETYVSLKGLRYALEQSLLAHRTQKEPAKPTIIDRTHIADNFSAAKRLRDNACIHCHQVYDFRRDDLQKEGKWRLDEVWVYPMPANIGLALDVNQGNRIISVDDASPCYIAGIRAGDLLLAVNGINTSSFADVQYGLHRAPVEGRIPIHWQREGKIHRAEINLVPGWRRSDISWRWSLRGLDPVPGVRGEDLTNEEKNALGLKEAQLAFRQGNFVSPEAEQAGIKQNDVILGVDGKQLNMNARQFAAYIKLNYKVGDTVTFNILRAGKKFDVAMKLVGRKVY